MPVDTEIIIERGDQVLRAIQAVRRTIEKAPENINRVWAKEGLRVVKKLTPRRKNRGKRLPGSVRGFPPLHKQWESVESVIRGNQITTIIRNRAEDDANGHLALLALEFGASPHVIEAEGGYPMQWWQSSTANVFVGRQSSGRGVFDIREKQKRRGGGKKGGRGIIYAWSVQHPGNEPFAMIAETKQHLAAVGKVVAREFGAKIGAAWRSGGEIAMGV